MTTEQLKERICKILDDKKAIDISIIRVDQMTIVADYFVICTGRSNLQVRTLAEEVEERLERENEIAPLRSDGVKDGKWAVLDYGGVIVHIFNDETRLFYCLEKLWTNGNGNNMEKYTG